MERKVQITADGSATILIPDMDVTYHSKHGAIQESNHVFINSGLAYFHSKRPEQSSVRIFEMGLGTGLNALLTILYADAHNLNVHYEAAEAYPLNAQELSAVNYADQLNTKETFNQLHTAPWDTKTPINQFFNLTKHHCKLNDLNCSGSFDIIYYDAFAPNAQPELWTEEVFKKLQSMLNKGGILTTYCSKSIVRKAMINAGFNVEKLAGPPGKREILRALK